MKSKLYWSRNYWRYTTMPQFLTALFYNCFQKHLSQHWDHMKMKSHITSSQYVQNPIHNWKLNAKSIITGWISPTSCNHSIMSLLPLLLLIKNALSKTLLLKRPRLYNHFIIDKSSIVQESINATSRVFFLFFFFLILGFYNGLSHQIFPLGIK